MRYAERQACGDGFRAIVGENSRAEARQIDRQHDQEQGRRGHCGYGGGRSQGKNGLRRFSSDTVVSGPCPGHRIVASGSPSIFEAAAALNFR